MSIFAECPSCHKKQSNRNKKCTCGEDLAKAKRSQRVNYWINYYLPNGKNRRELIGKKLSDAQAAEGKRKAQKREGRVLEMLPEPKITFTELTKWYLSLKKVKKLASYPTIKINLESFNKIFGDIQVRQIKLADIENYQATRKESGYSDSYIDQEIGAAKTMINKGVDNGKIGAEALIVIKKVKKLLKRNSNARNRILTTQEFEELLKYLPHHTKQIVATAFFTGMRRGEIINLTWEKVDLRKRIINLKAEDTKERKRREIPICEDLHAVLSGLPRSPENNHVFLFRGKPIKDIRGALKNACKKAKINE